MTLEAQNIKRVIMEAFHADTTTSYEETAERIIMYLKKCNYVILNKDLTVNQRNKASDAFHSNFQSIQATFDAIVKAAE